MPSHPAVGALISSDFDNSARVSVLLECKCGQSLAVVMGCQQMEYAQLVADEALPADSKAAIVVEVTTGMAFTGKDLAASGFDPDSGVSAAFELAKSELAGSHTDGCALPNEECVFVECNDTGCALRGAICVASGAGCDECCATGFLHALQTAEAAGIQALVCPMIGMADFAAVCEYLGLFTAFRDEQGAGYKLQSVFLQHAYGRADVEALQKLAGSMK